MLNINMTFGMALTIKKIKDRLLESVRQAEIMNMLQLGKQISNEELESQREWRKHLIGTQSQQRLELDTGDEPGYIFENRTGIELSLTVHDLSNLSIIDASQKKLSPFWINENEWRLGAKGGTSETFMT